MTDSGEDLKALLASDDRFAAPERGDLLQGTVIAQDSHGLIVDLGRKRDGVVPQSDLEKIPKEDTKLKTGDLISVMVIDPVDSDGNLLVSISQARESGDWLEARRVMENDELFNAEATSFNKGGLLVPFGHITGFVPASHLSGLPRGLDEGERLNYFNKIVGKQIPLKIIEVDPQRRRLVLSERKANYVKREQLLQELTEGEVRTGTVCNLVHFGAFLDLGGIDGLVHISELDWSYVDHPSDVLEPGQEIEVYVLDVDRERERIALSRKRLLPDPWYAITDELQVGHAVEGRVTSLADFGAFVDVGKGVEGLVHASEMPVGKVTMEELAPGQEVGVRVLEIDHDQRHIALSMRGIAHQIGQSVPSSVWEGRSGESAAERGTEDA